MPPRVHPYSARGLWVLDLSLYCRLSRSEAHSVQGPPPRSRTRMTEAAVNIHEGLGPPKRQTLEAPEEPRDWEGMGGGGHKHEGEGPG